jgi:hypothetical protein
MLQKTTLGVGLTLFLLIGLGIAATRPPEDPPKNKNLKILPMKIWIRSWMDLKRPWA